MVDADVERKRARRRTRRYVLGAVLLILCGLAATGGTYVYDKYQDASGPAQDSARAFLTALRDGDYPAAYDRLCRRTKGDFTQAAFISGATANRLTGYDMTGAQVSVGGGSLDARVTVRLRYANGFAAEQTVRVLEEDGSWKVCGDPY